MSLKKFLSREIPIAKMFGYTHIWHSIVVDVLYGSCGIKE